MLLQARTAAAADGLKPAAAELARRLEAVPHVEQVVNPYDTAVGGQVSKDGRSALLSFEITGDDDAAAERVDATLDTTAAVQKAYPDLRVEQVGSASADKAFEKTKLEHLRQRATRGRIRRRLTATAVRRLPVGLGIAVMTRSPR